MGYVGGDVDGVLHLLGNWPRSTMTIRHFLLYLKSAFRVVDRSLQLSEDTKVANQGRANRLACFIARLFYVLIRSFIDRIQLMKFLYMFAPLLLLVPLPVLATQTDAPDCRAPSSQADMNRCAFEDFLIVNGAQAAVLNGLTQRLPAPDRRRLRAAQKAWIAWRTAQCAFETGGSSGGSAHQMALWTCQARLVSERTTALEKLAKCPEGDIACPGRKP